MCKNHGLGPSPQRRSSLLGTSLAVQWLRLCAANAGRMGLITGWGTKILHCSTAQPKKRERKIASSHLLWLSFSSAQIIFFKKKKWLVPRTALHSDYLYLTVLWVCHARAMQSLSCTVNTVPREAKAQRRSGRSLGKVDVSEKCWRWLAPAKPGHKPSAFSAQNERC